MFLLIVISNSSIATTMEAMQPTQFVVAGIILVKQYLLWKKYAILHQCMFVCLFMSACVFLCLSVFFTTTTKTNKSMLYRWKKEHYLTSWSLHFLFIVFFTLFGTTREFASLLMHLLYNSNNNNKILNLKWKSFQLNKEIFAANNKIVFMLIDPCTLSSITIKKNLHTPRHIRILNPCVYAN